MKICFLNIIQWFLITEATKKISNNNNSLWNNIFFLSFVSIGVQLISRILNKSKGYGKFLRRFKDFKAKLMSLIGH